MDKPRISIEEFSKIEVKIGTVRSVERWIQRNAEALAEQADVVFEPGHPGRFLRQPLTDI